MTASTEPRELFAYYDGFDEADRLASGEGLLEFVRMQELIHRFLPSPPQVVLDVGGGPGRYACWLARDGHEVHLVDPVPKHLEQAREAFARQPDHPPASIALGDARSLDRHDESADAVLLMGPLYHLNIRAQRTAALGEARPLVGIGSRPPRTHVAQPLRRDLHSLRGARGPHLDAGEALADQPLEFSLLDGHRGVLAMVEPAKVGKNGCREGEGSPGPRAADVRMFPRGV